MASAETALQRLHRLDVQSVKTVVDTHKYRCVWRSWGAGPSLVLVHGGSGSWTHWLNNIDDFSRNHRVLVPDLLGFGDSSAHVTNITFKDIVGALVAGLRDLAKSEPVSLVGFSFGALVGAAVTGNPSVNAIELVLVGPAGLGGCQRNRSGLRNWRGEASPQIRAAIHRHNLAAFMLHAEAAIDYPTVCIHAKNIEAAKFVSKGHSRSSLMIELLRRLKVPTGIIWGKNDVTVSGLVDKKIPELEKLRPDLKFIVIPDAGHWVQFEKPLEFKDALNLLLTPGRI